MIGFVSAASDRCSIYVLLWKQNAAALIFAILPRLFSGRVAKKLLDLIDYISRQGKKRKGDLSAELLSMVVAENYRGQGIAQLLFKQLTVEFRRWGIERFKIVVGVGLQQAQRFYEKMGAHKARKMEFHPGEPSWEYVVEVKR